MTENGVIQVTEHIPHPPSKVWAALTTPELHAKWWAAGDVKPVVAHRFTLDMGQWGQQPCEVLAAEPERLLSYTFRRARSTRSLPGGSNPRARAHAYRSNSAASTSTHPWAEPPMKGWVAVGPAS